VTISDQTVTVGVSKYHVILWCRWIGAFYCIGMSSTRSGSARSTAAAALPAPGGGSGGDGDDGGGPPAAPTGKHGNSHQTRMWNQNMILRLLQDLRELPSNIIMQIIGDLLTMPS
jgi:hypothetical protein